MPKTWRYEVRTLDVWGNPEYGFEVNDTRAVGFVELRTDGPAPTDEALIVALIDARHLDSVARKLAEVEDLGDGELLTIVEKDDGRPVLGLSLCVGEEKS